MALHPEFLAGRVPPKDYKLGSRELRDWYDEHIYRAHEGLTINGTRLTGDHYWFLNFQPLELFYNDPVSGTPVTRWDYGFYSRADDWVYKQFEEAAQEHLASAMMTGRGAGKTYLVLSVGSKTYYLERGSHNIISAAIDDHANPSFNKMKSMIVELEKKHPSLALKRIKNDDDIIAAGEVKIIEGNKTPIYSSMFEKIVYGNSPGKTKGRRIRFQQWEEWGDWSCHAALKKCIEASRGTWKVGDVHLARVFYTGTGGTVKSDQARDIYYNPLAYGIYPVQPYEARKISVLIPDYLPEDDVKTPIFLPAIVKRGGFYEFDRFDADGNLLFEAGEDDLVGAYESLMAERKLKESDPEAYDVLTQEYPTTREEVFQQGGAGEFDRPRISQQRLRLKQGKVALPLPTPCPEGFVPRTFMERGRLEWVLTGSTRTGVRWEYDPNGLIYVAEHPPRNEKGELLALEDAYIAGLDSIDQGEADSVGTGGSKLAIAVKKRHTSLSKVSNFYTCFYAERPDEPEDAFDNVVKILWYFNCKVNLEYTKITIKGYMREHGEFHRFVRRPKICLATVDEAKVSNLIGTHWDGAGYVLGHALRLLKKQIRYFLELFYHDEALKQLFDYTRAQKTKFDYVAAMLLAELADEDLADVPPSEVREPEPIELPRYYTDEHGYQQYGVPHQTSSQDLLAAARRAARQVSSAPDLLDEHNRDLRTRPLSYVSDYDGEPQLARVGGP